MHFRGFVQFIVILVWGDLLPGLLLISACICLRGIPETLSSEANVLMNLVVDIGAAQKNTSQVAMSYIYASIMHGTSIDISEKSMHDPPPPKHTFQKRIHTCHAFQRPCCSHRLSPTHIAQGTNSAYNVGHNAQ